MLRTQKFFEILFFAASLLCCFSASLLRDMKVVFFELYGLLADLVNWWSWRYLSRV